MDSERTATCFASLDLAPTLEHSAAALEIAPLTRSRFLLHSFPIFPLVLQCCQKAPPSAALITQYSTNTRRFSTLSELSDWRHLVLRGTKYPESIIEPNHRSTGQELTCKLVSLYV